MIRLFASDMDGTLLNSSGTISGYTADSIRRLQTCGIEFIVNTGREYAGAKKELDAAGTTNMEILQILLPCRKARQKRFLRFLKSMEPTPIFTPSRVKLPSKTVNVS